uniref:Arf-GAP domain and FG repeat-containing protein 1 n=2 Tax=Bactrocera dorsalis TaxID=27457 RepID=A0A034VXR6_BACDO
MAAVVRKKQDDKYLQVLRELVTNGGGNRQCFDCGQKGPTYVNMTIGSFVCTRCSGVLRGLTPPHRVKSISMATFTQDDVDFLKSHGNDECAKTWLGLWDPKRAVHQDQRELMIDKYERKRYYLEPASPLKSLTNAVSLKSGSVTAPAAGAGVEVATTSGVRATVATGNSSAATTSNGSSTYKSNGDGQIDFVHVSNGFGHIGHNTKNQYKNGERSFHLTPPSTQRTTMNGLHKSVTTTTVSAPNSSGKSTSAISRPQQHQQNGYSHLQDAFMPKNNNINNNGGNKNNELNVLHMTSSRMSDSSSSTSVNGFGADADFVADFGSANIFDATTTSARNKISSPPILNGGGNAISSNGYARIQPLKKQQQQYQLLNGHGQTNGNSSHGDTIDNGTTENFADFEHAPIFNAAGLPIPNNNNNFRTMNNQHNNSHNNNNNNTLSSTPSEDRYAALKDLDEQLRESKAAATVVNAYSVDAFGNNGISNGVNPFKQQQANPFQAVTHGTSPTATQNYFGQMTVISNGNGIPPHAPSAAAQFYYNTNGFGNAATSAGTATAMFPHTVIAAGPSGCGFGLGALQPTAIAATGAGGGAAFNNPFTASGAMSTNNPFL